MKLQDFENCINCDKPVGDANQFIFYRVAVEPMGMNLRALQQIEGLTMMLGGQPQSQRVALALAPDDELAKPIPGAPKRTFLVCGTCATCLAEHGLALDEMLAKAEERAHRS